MFLIIVFCLFWGSSAHAQNIPLELKFLPFKRAYNHAKSGKINGIFNFYKTKERLNFFDYTETIIKNPLVLFVRKDSTLSFHKLEDLKGREVGVMRGYTHGTDFDQSTLFNKIKADSHKSNFKKLVLGRITAYPCDRFVGIHVAMKNNLMSELKTLPEPLKVRDSGKSNSSLEIKGGAKAHGCNENPQGAATASAKLPAEISLPSIFR